MTRASASALDGHEVVHLGDDAKQVRLSLGIGADGTAPAQPFEIISVKTN